MEREAQSLYPTKQHTKIRKLTPVFVTYRTWLAKEIYDVWQHESFPIGQIRLKNLIYGNPRIKLRVKKPYIKHRSDVGGHDPQANFLEVAFFELCLFQDISHELCLLIVM